MNPGCANVWMNAVEGEEMLHPLTVSCSRCDSPAFRASIGRSRRRWATWLWRLQRHPSIITTSHLNRDQQGSVSSHDHGDGFDLQTCPRCRRRGLSRCVMVVASRNAPATRADLIPHMIVFDLDSQAQPLQNVCLLRVTKLHRCHLQEDRS